MLILLDVLTVLTAVAALIVSIRAIRVAKRAPFEERTRGNRDSVRDALLSLRDPYFKALYALDRGHDIADRPEALEMASEILDQLGPRLPEHLDLVLLKVRLDGVSSRWRGVEVNFAEIRRASESVDYWERRLSELSSDASETSRTTVLTAITEARADEQKARDERIEVRASLREALVTSRKANAEYINDIDAQDRLPPA